MIIIKDRPGQLCNRIWAYAPFIDLALSHDIKIVIIGFSDYEHLFEDLNRYPQVRILKETDHRAYRFYTKLISLISKVPEPLLNLFRIHYHRNSYSSILSQKGRLIFIDSWHHEKPKAELNKDRLKELFRAEHDSEKKVDEFIGKKRQVYEVLVGVHIRRGDYKEYKHGQYYYTDEQYADFLEQIKSQIPEKKVCFILCSNIDINLEKYRPLKVFRMEDPGMIEDLHSLAQCDYILGPPSTYSMWASFIGETPLLLVKDPTRSITMEAFSPIVSQNTFENGTVFNH